MPKNHTTEEIMSWILTTGMLISLFLVILGGIMYLIQYGNEPLNIKLLQANHDYTTLKQIWQGVYSFSPFGIIQLGVIVLVATQVARVGLLIWFYTLIRDYGFALISVFILLIILYSFFGRH